MTRSLALLVIGTVLLRAQETPPADARPTHDPAALALLDRADSVIYSPKLAGLQGLTYVQVLPHLPDVRIEVAWSAPKSTHIEILVPPETPPRIREAVRASDAAIRKTVERCVDLVVGKENRASFAGDEIRSVPERPREVLIVARSERTKEIFSEHRLRFDEAGFPTSSTSETPRGKVEMQVTYRKVGDRTVVDSVKSSLPASTMDMSFEYLEVDGFLFVHRITTKTDGSGPPLVQEFKDFRVQRGSQAGEGKKD